jgi:hypothetical protein
MAVEISRCRAYILAMSHVRSIVELYSDLAIQRRSDRGFSLDDMDRTSEPLHEYFSRA